MHYQPELNRPYTDDELDDVLTDALRVLQELGIACEHRETIDRVTAEPGIRHESGRLKFDPDTMRAHLDEVRRRNAGRPDEEPQFEALASWCCLNYADPETGRVRPPTTEDAVQMTRLMDARGCSNWSIPLVPMDVAPRHATLTGEYVAMKHSRGLGGFMAVLDPAEIEFLIEMNQAVGRTYLLDEQIGISPLRFNDHGLEAALKFAGRDDVKVILVGAIPSVGATTPLPIRSALTQTVAEGLGLSLVSVRLGFGEGGFGCGLQPFEFQYAGIIFGGPEEMLMRLASSQMGAFLNGRRGWIGTFHSMARMPDAQAAAERTAGVLWQAMHGVRRFRGVGQLAVDEVFSPQQAIIDDDILALVARAVRGMDPLATDGDPVEEIAEGLSEGTFLAQPATVAQYRQFMQFPELFRRYNVGHWQNLGSPTILDEAWQRAQQLIDENDFELPADQARDLDRIYRKALQTIT
ncbi:MAG: hypothetical protein GWP05_04840 [Anaerolineaceae bacterium]|nr:hypothetical protein [Anaerolineaceae bacterium]